MSSAAGARGEALSTIRWLRPQGALSSPGGGGADLPWVLQNLGFSADEQWGSRTTNPREIVCVGVILKLRPQADDHVGDPQRFFFSRGTDR